MALFLVVAIVGIGFLLLSTQAGASVGALSASQIRSYAANAGFTGDDLNTAVAIAMAESSGNANALGDMSLGVSVGLWQVNLKAHPEYTQQELFDPQTNANAAYNVYSDAGDFTPWSTFKNGAYQQYLA